MSQSPRSLKFTCLAMLLSTLATTATPNKSKSDRLKSLVERSKAVAGTSHSDEMAEESNNYEIQQALADPKKHTVYCQAAAGFWRTMGDTLASEMAGREYYQGDYIVTFASNLGLIAMAANQAHERYEPFDLEDIDPALYQRSMTLLIHPVGQYMGNVAAAGQIKHVVIRRRKTNREDIIQPNSVELSPEVYSNLFGAKFTASSAIVEFDYKNVLDIASRGDVEAVVITTAGERRCWVDNAKIVEMFQ